MKSEMLTEKARIDQLFQNGRITKEDHATLIAALGSNNHFLKRLFIYATNPFQVLAASTNLLVGCISVVVMCWVGANLDLHFRGALDFQILPEGARTFSFLELLVQNAVNIFCVSTIFFLGALLRKCKNLRVIDFVSSIAYARLAYAFFALILLALTAAFPNFFPKKLEDHNVVESAVLGLLGISFLVWQVTLLFSALKESSGLKGKSLIWTSVIGIVLAEASSYAINTLLIKIM